MKYWIYLCLPQWLKDYLSKLLKSDINKKILHGSFWSLLGTFLSKSLLLIASIICARILGSQEYGELGVIRSTVNMFTAFAGLGLGLTATKYIAEYKNINQIKTIKIIKLSNVFSILSGSIFVIIILVFSKRIALQINAPHLGKEIQIGAFMLFFNILNGVQAGILSGFENFKAMAKNNLYAGIISFFLQILLIIYWGLTGSLVGFGLNFLFLWILNRLSIQKHIKHFAKINFWDRTLLSEISVLWKFSLPAVLSGIMVGPVIWLCNAMLVNQPNGYPQMALFEIANQWRITVIFIPAALSQIILPMLSSSLDNRDDYVMIVKKNLKANLYVSVIISIVITMLTPIVTLFYGSCFNGLTSPFIIMIWTTVLIAINGVIGQVIASQGRMWIGFFVNTCWAVVLLLSVFVSINIYRLGAIGMTISYLISYAIHTLIVLFIANKFLKYNMKI